MARKRLSHAGAGDPRQAIIESAVALFHRQGYHGTTLEDIALDLGVTKGAIYYHFSKKSEILYVIHDQFIDILLSRVEERDGASGDPVDELREIIRDVLWLMEHMPNYVRVFFEELRELDDSQLPGVKTKRDRYTRHAATTYQRGVQEGRFREVPGGLPVMALFGMANWSYQWYRSGGPLEHGQVADHFSDILLRGICTDEDPEDASPVEAAATTKG